MGLVTSRGGFAVAPLGEMHLQNQTARRQLGPARASPSLLPRMLGSPRTQSSGGPQNAHPTHSLQNLEPHQGGNPPSLLLVGKTLFIALITHSLLKKTSKAILRAAVFPRMVAR